MVHYRNSTFIHVKYNMHAIIISLGGGMPASFYQKGACQHHFIRRESLSPFRLKMSLAHHFLLKCLYQDGKASYHILVWQGYRFVLFLSFFFQILELFRQCDILIDFHVILVNYIVKDRCHFHIPIDHRRYTRSTIITYLNLFMVFSATYPAISLWSVLLVVEIR